MSRLRPRIVTQQDAQAIQRGLTAVVRGEAAPGAAVKAGVSADSYLNQVVKYIPAEIMALQQLLNGGADYYQPGTPGRMVFGWLSIGLLVLTPFWFAESTRDAGETVAWSQVLLSTTAFAVWLLAVNSPAVGVLEGFQVSPDLLDKNLWSVLFPFFVGVAPMLRKIFSRVG